MKVFKTLGIIAVIAIIVFEVGCDSGSTSNDLLALAALVKKPTVPEGMVKIPGGTFIMGSPVTEPDSLGDDTQHSAKVSTFYLGKYQVTQKQWYEVMGKTIDEQRIAAGYSVLYGEGDNFPMYYVSWYEVLVFCNRLSKKEGLSPAYSISGSTDPDDWIGANGGNIPTSNNATWNSAVMVAGAKGYRLPTEAEWEYACRGSYPNKATETDTKPFGIGDGDKMVAGMANFNTRYTYALPGGHKDEGAGSEAANAYLARTAAVGTYAPNNYGLYDMHGNVWEWCWDWYDDYPGDGEVDYKGPDTESGTYGASRVLRGGAWDYYGQYLRSAIRSDDLPFDRYYDIGFRLARP